MGHIQPGGTYHYHALPTGLYERLGGSYPWNVPPGTPYTVTDVAPIRLGWAWDGVPVYGPICYHTPATAHSPNWYKPTSRWTLKTGCRPSTGPPGTYNGDYHYDWHYTGGDLDECNGHSAAVSENGTSFYHYLSRFWLRLRCLNAGSNLPELILVPISRDSLSHSE
jgi:YHYH protein